MDSIRAYRSGMIVHDRQIGVSVGTNYTELQKLPSMSIDDRSGVDHILTCALVCV